MHQRYNDDGCIWGAIMKLKHFYSRSHRSDTLWCYKFSELSSHKFNLGSTAHLRDAKYYIKTNTFSYYTLLYCWLWNLINTNIYWYDSVIFWHCIFSWCLRPNLIYPNPTKKVCSVATNICLYWIKGRTFCW